MIPGTSTMPPASTLRYWSLPMHCRHHWMHERGNVWMSSEWTNEWMNEWVTPVSVWPCDSLTEWVGECVTYRHHCHHQHLQHHHQHHHHHHHHNHHYHHNHHHYWHLNRSVEPYAGLRQAEKLHEYLRVQKMRSLIPHWEIDYLKIIGIYRNFDGKLLHSYFMTVSEVFLELIAPNLMILLLFR